MKRLLCAFAICVLLVTAGSAVRAQEAKGFRAELIGNVGYAQKQIMDLENAIPDAKMTWRPNADVRSISEVYSHIAFGNYLFGKMIGAALPAGVVIASPEDEKKWETVSTDKKVIAEQLEKSFSFVKTAIGNLPDANLDNMVDFFGQKMTIRSVLLAFIGHMHEHFGQSIAYARMQGIVPPWTAAQMAAEKAKK
jgi:uncharacterized damage-inducible protein DinB